MGSIFRGGVPIAPDVKKLFERFGTPAEDSLIPYAEIESLIGVRYESTRFHTVVSTWRKLLDRPPYSRRMTADSSVRAYRVLSGDAHVRHADRKVNLGLRGIRRQVASIVAIEPTRLSEEGKQQRDHTLLMAAPATTMHRQTMTKRRIPVLADSNVGR